MPGDATAPVVGEYSTQRKVACAVVVAIFAALVYTGVQWFSKPPLPPEAGRALLKKIEGQ